MSKTLTFITYTVSDITTMIGSEFFEWRPRKDWSYDTAIDEFHSMIRYSTKLGTDIQGWVIEDDTGEVMYHFH